MSGQAFGLILSVFAVVALGAGLGRTRIFGEAAVKGLNDFVWHVAVPALLFRVMSTQPLPGGGELMLVGLYYGTAFAVFIAVMAIGHLFFRLKAAERPVWALSACFANGMMVGVPVIDGAFGPEGLRILFLLLAFHGPLFVTVTTVLAESARNRQDTIGATIGRSAASLVRQTPLVALVLGVLAAAVGVQAPPALDRMLEVLAAAVAPCGLFAVGASLSYVPVRGNFPQAGVAVAVKLLVMPLAVLAVTRWAGVPALWSAVATTMAALPTGIVSYNVAAALNIAPKRNAAAILLANIFAIVTLTYWLGLVTGNG